MKELTKYLASYIYKILLLMFRINYKVEQPTYIIHISIYDVYNSKSIFKSLAHDLFYLLYKKFGE